MKAWPPDRRQEGRLPEVNSGYRGVWWRFGVILTDSNDLPDSLVSVLGGYPPNGSRLPDPSELVT